VRPVLTTEDPGTPLTAAAIIAGWLEDDSHRYGFVTLAKALLRAA
jgi:hypothetical protein